MDENKSRDGPPPGPPGPAMYDIPGAAGPSGAPPPGVPPTGAPPPGVPPPGAPPPGYTAATAGQPPPQPQQQGFTYGMSQPPAGQPVYTTQPPGYTQPMGTGYTPGTYPTASYPTAPYRTGGTTSVVVTGPVHYQAFGQGRTSTKCASCQQDIVTNISYQIGTYTWLLVGMMVLFGCWIGCCLIPLCIDGCKDVVHTCPNCNAQVGIYSRMN